MDVEFRCKEIDELLAFYGNVSAEPDAIAGRIKALREVGRFHAHKRKALEKS